MFQKDIAKKHCITPALVNRIIKRSEREPNFFAQQVCKRVQKRHEKEAVAAAVADANENDVDIYNAEQIHQVVEADLGYSVSKKTVRLTIKKDLAYSFRKEQLGNAKINCDKNLVLRQQYALIMLALHELDWTVLNIDESVLSSMRFKHRLWLKKGESGIRSRKTVMPRLSMFAGIDNHGRVYAALS